MLESRRLLSVSAYASGSTLYIQGDSAGQEVQIFESVANGTRLTGVRVDATRNGSFSDAGDIAGKTFAGITSVVARLGLGDDRLSITLSDPLEGASTNYDVRLGAGNDAFQYSNPIGNDIRNSDVTLAVDAGQGADSLALNLNRVSGSSVRANFYGGADDDSLVVTNGDDIVDANVNIYADMGKGNDSVRQLWDWEGLDLVGSASVLRLTAFGGDGNDSLEAAGELGGPGALVDGTLDTRLYGDAGDDSIAFNLDHLSLRGGTLLLRGNGYTGSDQLSLTGTVDAPSTGGGLIDVALRGSGGNDTLTVNADASPLNSYAPPGAVLLDGGGDIDSASVSGSILTTSVSIEN